MAGSLPHTFLVRLVIAFVALCFWAACTVLEWFARLTNRKD
jgi:hypothetical protein